MADARFLVFDVVTIATSEETRGLELAGAEGVVSGVNQDETTREDWLAVQVGDLPTVMLQAKDLHATGRAVPRDAVYGGARIAVSRDGHVRRDDEATDGDRSSARSHARPAADA